VVRSITSGVVCGCSILEPARISLNGRKIVVDVNIIGLRDFSAF
jgi:hypothetical protein